MIRKVLLTVIALIGFSIPAQAEQFSLTDLMNAHYGAGKWSMRSAAGVGTDIGPALMDGLKRIRAGSGHGIINIPAGHWLYVTPVDPALLSGNYIAGEGIAASMIIFDNRDGNAFEWSAAGAYIGGGMRDIMLMLERGLGDTNAHALVVRGDEKHQPDLMTFENICVSALGADSYWYSGLEVDGSARAVPQGVRTFTFRNIQLFNNRYLGASFSNAVQFLIEDLGIYTPKAGTSGGDMWITGGAKSWTDSIFVSVSRLNIAGTLHLDHASEIGLEGKAARLETGPTATYISGWLHAPTTSGMVGAASNLIIRN